MTRFAALDLAALPDLPVLRPLDFDAVLEARLAELEAHLSDVFNPEKAASIMALARNIASSPTRYLSEAAAARELYMENRINEAVRSVFLSMARGAALDHIGAGRGVVRKVLDHSDPDAPVYEADDAFRARIQLVIEAWSPHGTEGSYVYWALDADDLVVDVAVYGPNHGIDPPIPPAEPKMVILSREGDGTASEYLLARVFQHCAADTRRPVADKLSVVSAVPVAYSIEAVLHVTSPEAASAVLAAAEASAAAFINSRIRIGRKLYRTSIAAALNVQGVVDVELISPAADLDIGPFEAAHCTDMTLSIQTITGGWRDI
ncbi:phage-related baseplate assembly protein [Rubricella aquisinus]|uniref:Phage-related baseplate assembly protein n=1 Tax=Rubricella aquisinus TaxID=2028108 RepID=A0A840X1J8_9RHOB|nr:baseplate J/gp47 family protein [Rubricella aquisinus]MBB5515765.1 phage-related baseplate assembly protein [Rubricella aquisinus]